MNIQKQQICFGKSEVGYFIASIRLFACILWVKGEQGFKFNVVLKSQYMIEMLLTASIFLIKYFKGNTVRGNYLAVLFLFIFRYFPFYYSPNTEILGIVFLFRNGRNTREKING